MACKGEIIHDRDSPSSHINHRGALNALYARPRAVQEADAHGIPGRDIDVLLDKQPDIPHIDLCLLLLNLQDGGRPWPSYVLLPYRSRIVTCGWRAHDAWQHDVCHATSRYIRSGRSTRQFMRSIQHCIGAGNIALLNEPS